MPHPHLPPCTLGLPHASCPPPPTKHPRLMPTSRHIPTGSKKPHAHLPPLTLGFPRASSLPNTIHPGLSHASCPPPTIHPRVPTRLIPTSQDTTLTGSHTPHAHLQINTHGLPYASCPPPYIHPQTPTRLTMPPRVDIKPVHHRSLPSQGRLLFTASHANDQ